MLRQRSRPYLFSNTVAPTIVTASIAAIDMLSASTERRDHLERVTARFRSGMEAAGFDLDPGCSPHRPGDAWRCSARCDHGRRPARRGHLRDRVQLPGRAARRGAHSRAGSQPLTARLRSTERSRRSSRSGGRTASSPSSTSPLRGAEPQAIRAPRRLRRRAEPRHHSGALRSMRPSCDSCGPRRRRRCSPPARLR